MIMISLGSLCLSKKWVDDTQGVLEDSEIYDNDNDKQYIFRHVCPYNIKKDIDYAQC